MRTINFQDLKKEDKPVLDRHFSSGYYENSHFNFTFNSAKAKLEKPAEPEPEPEDPEPTKEELLLAEIRDLLKEQSK